MDHLQHKPDGAPLSGMRLSAPHIKPVLLAGAAFLAFAAFAPSAQAQRATFSYTGKLVTYKVPTTALYQITAYGAQGGSAAYDAIDGPGGLGAEIGGNFILTAGEDLQIAVGGAGASEGHAAGGGGGSFVVGGPDATPLVIAGGGGGGSVGPLPGGGGLTGPDGGGGGGVVPGAGGTNGNGGRAGRGGGENGGGGGGFFSGGDSGLGVDVNSTGGGAFPNLAGGYLGGGFGGGGGAGVGLVFKAASGGGGGYSGGGGGGNNGPDTINGNGGGGGSFNAGINRIQVAGTQTGNGEVIIKTIFVGTPGKPSCHGEVVSNLAKQYGGLLAAAAALGYSSVPVMQSDIATYCAGTSG